MGLHFSFPQSQQPDTISCELSHSQNTSLPAHRPGNLRQRHAPIPADGSAGYLYHHHHQPNRRAHGRHVEPRQHGMPKQACLDAAMQRLDTPMTAAEAANERETDCGKLGGHTRKTKAKQKDELTARKRGRREWGKYRCGPSAGINSQGCHAPVPVRSRMAAGANVIARQRRRTSDAKPSPCSRVCSHVCYHVPSFGKVGAVVSRDHPRRYELAVLFLFGGIMPPASPSSWMVKRTKKYHPQALNDDQAYS